MRTAIFGLFSAKSMFARFMASFFLIIVIISSFHWFSYKFYMANIQKELVDNSSERLEIIANKFDNYFEQIMNALYRISGENRFMPVLSGKDPDSYEKTQIKRLIDDSKTVYPHVSNIFVINDNSDTIISSDGVFDKDGFFTKFYKSDTYDKDFWLMERGKRFYYNIYETGIFTDSSDPSTTYSNTFLPIVFKNNAYSDFMLVALVDINAVAADNENSFLQNFYVFNQDKKSIYPVIQNTDITNQVFSSADTMMRTREGYLLTRSSKISGIRYAKLLTNAELAGLLTRENSLLVIIILVSIFVSLMLSYILAKRTDGLAKKIVDIIGVANHSFQNSKRTDLKYIGSDVQKIVLQNTIYDKEIKTKDSLLEESFYNTRIKDIYLTGSDFKGKIAANDKYVLVCITLHHREAFMKEMKIEQSKSTFYMKELIHQIMGDRFPNSITFQSEKNLIVSIISLKNGETFETAVVEELMDNLNEEDLYVFFTVTVSKVRSDMLELGTVYNDMLELSKHRKPMEKNQIIVEGDAANRNVRYKFTVDQVVRLTQFIYNRRQEECIQQIEEILDYNCKLDVDNFNIGVLCTEIINCGLKAINEMSKGLRENVDVEEFYTKINQCLTIEQYKKLCRDFISCISAGSTAYDRGREYIIEYIKEYVEHHFSEDIYLDLLAEKLGLTREYISIYFKNKTGINFSDYINDVRIQKAIGLLKNPSMKVQEIGSRVGIVNVNTFIRVFKRYTGKTPNEYRYSNLMV